ncbi:MAG: hypothetical protein AB1324_05230 [Candidatus Micrarchaeota archaeon]
MEERFRIRLFGRPYAKEPMLCRLNRHFRRKGVSDALLPEGSREIALRNGTKVVFRKSTPSMWAREPFVEMDVRTSGEYAKKSVDAMHAFAKKRGIGLEISVEKIER